MHYQGLGPELVKKPVSVKASLDPDDAASALSIQEEFLKAVA